MPLPTFFINAQNMAYQETAFVALNNIEGNYTDDAATHRWFPLLTDQDGNLMVTLGGAGGGPILLPDNVDDVAEVATNSRLPTLARLVALDGETETDFDRLRTDDDAVETQFSNSKPALRVMGRNRLFSEALGDTWSREHAQDGVSVAASASRTVATTFGTFINVNHRTLHVVVDVTVIGADDLTVEIQGRQLFPPFDFYPLLTSLGISTVGTTVLKVGVGFSPIPNLTANDMITAVWQVVATPAGVDPITYSINANLGI